MHLHSGAAGLWDDNTSCSNVDYLFDLYFYIYLKVLDNVKIETIRKGAMEGTRSEKSLWKGRSKVMLIVFNKTLGRTIDCIKPTSQVCNLDVNMWSDLNLINLIVRLKNIKFIGMCHLQNIGRRYTF